MSSVVLHLALFSPLVASLEDCVSLSMPLFLSFCSHFSSGSEAAKSVFPPSERLREHASVSSMEQYKKLYEQSLQDTDKFWAEVSPFAYLSVFSASYFALRQESSLCLRPHTSEHNSIEKEHTDKYAHSVLAAHYPPPIWSTPLTLQTVVLFESLCPVWSTSLRFHNCAFVCLGKPHTSEHNDIEKEHMYRMANTHIFCVSCMLPASHLAYSSQTTNCGAVRVSSSCLIHKLHVFVYVRLAHHFVFPTLRFSVLANLTRCTVARFSFVSHSAHPSPNSTFINVFPPLSLLSHTPCVLVVTSFFVT